MKPNPPIVYRVTDHSLVRFIERAGGFDLAPLREAIGASLGRAIAHAGKIGETSFIVRADGLRYVVKAGTVITITDDNRGDR